jgi:hypothetical protein
LKARNESGILGLIVGPVLSEIFANLDHRLLGLGGCVNCHTKASTELTLPSRCAVEVDGDCWALLHGELRERRSGRKEGDEAVLGE